MSVSAAGSESVTHEPRFRDAISKCNGALDTVVERHGTIDHARDIKSPGYDAYVEAKRCLQTTTRTLMSRVRQIECSEAVNRSSDAMTMPTDQSNEVPATIWGHKMEPSPVMLSRSMTTTEIWHIISSNREPKTSHLIQSTTPIRTLNFWQLDESS